MHTYYEATTDYVKSIRRDTRPSAGRRSVLLALVLRDAGAYGISDASIPMAGIAGVARATMCAARAVVRHGDTDLIADVLAGRISLHRAAVVARAQTKRIARQAKRQGGILAGEVRA